MEWLGQLAILATIGCSTAIALTVIHNVFESGKRELREKLSRAQDRIALLEQRAADLERHNEQLASQHEWATRLLKAQEQPRFVLSEQTSGREREGENGPPLGLGGDT